MLFLFFALAFVIKLTASGAALWGIIHVVALFVIVYEIYCARCGATKN